MRRFFYSLIAFFAFFIGFLYFTTTPYFFDKYIAPTIRNYNFNYKSVQGTLLSGFEVEELKYKDKKLASYVELKFNPLALLKKRISITKLALKDVNKEALKLLVEDFKSDTKESDKEPKSNKILTPIALDFELKNVSITFKPFKVNNLSVYKNSLNIDSISYISGKIQMDKNRYYYDTNLGRLEFEGEFKNQELHIKKLFVENFDIESSLKLLKTLEQKGDSNKTRIETNNTKEIESNVLFIPKKIIVDNLEATLKPFAFHKIDITKLFVKGKDIELDLQEKKLYKAFLELSIITSISDFSTQIVLKDKKLKIPSVEIALLNSNEFLTFIESFNEKKTSVKENNTSSDSFNILAYLPTNSLDIESFHLLLKSFKLKNERIKKFTISAKNTHFDFLKKKLAIKYNKILLDSSLGKVKIEASLNEKVTFEKLVIKIKNGDKLLAFLKSFDSKKENNSSFEPFVIIPSKLYIKKSAFVLKQLSFKPYIIKEGELRAQNTLIDMKKQAIIKGALQIKNNSNWGEAFLKGNIKKNIYYSEGFLKVTQTLLDNYKVPLKAKNLKTITIQEGIFSLDDLKIKAHLSGKDIFKTRANVDILSSLNKIYYNYKNSKFLWDIEATIKEPLINTAQLKNHVQVINGKFSYNGVVQLNNLNLPKNVEDFIKDLQVHYKGDAKNLEATFSTTKLEGKLFAKEYKKGFVEIKNKRPLDISKLISLEKSKIDKISIKAPINFLQPLPIKGELLIASNLLDFNGEWSYNQYFTLKGLVTNSKLLPKDIKRRRVFPLKLNLEYQKNLKLLLANKIVSSKLLYDTKTQLVDAKIDNRAFKIKASGTTKELSIDFSTPSIKKSLKEISLFYPIKEIPDINGPLELHSDTNFKEYSFGILSPKIQVGKAKEATLIKDFLLEGNYKNSQILIKRYRAKVKDFSLFSNKSSLLALQKDNIVIKKFFINDNLIVSGIYNFTKSKGKLKLKANNFHFKNRDYDLTSSLNTTLSIFKDKYTLEGVINIIKAKVKKNLENRNAIESDDIIILQKEAQKKSSFFVKNVKLNLKVNTKKGILYAQNGSYFIAYPKLKIKKQFRRFVKMNGVINLDKRSYYMFKDKKLRVKRGKITFKGNSSIAYLSIVMYYKGRDYDIYITISGTSDRPVIYFSSNPPLTKEQILAYLLFNDIAPAGTHSQESMLNLVGGVLAKSFFGSIGLKIDKLSIKEDGFSIGKAINDKVIIYYNQKGETPSIKTRIDITKSVHSVIEIGEEKQSVDIIFSKEY